MNRKFIPLLGLSLCVATPFFGQTQADAEALVKKALAFAKANGMYKMIQAVNQQNPELRNGELYVWVLDLEEKVMAAHGATAKLIGKDFSEAKDANEVPYAQKAVDIAVDKGSGWLEYKFRNPVTQKMGSKMSYVEKYHNFVIGCGIYKD